MERTHILVPLDGSDVAEAALPYAEAVARLTGAGLRLLTVVSKEPAGLTGRPPEVREFLERVAGETLGAYLAATLNSFDSSDVAVATSLVIGDPVDEILAATDEPDIAMTVMATHGRGGAARLLVGSVADAVMRLSTRPVLLVRPPESDQAPSPVTFRRLLVPLDGSADAELALAPATELASAAGARLCLVRVEPWLSAMTAPYGYLPDLTRMDQQVAEEAEAYLERVRGTLPKHIAADATVLRGAPAGCLTEYLEEQDRPVDLTVMTTHGRGGLRRLLLGSTADRLVRSGAPVLLLRPPVAAPAAALAGQTGQAAPARHCHACNRLISFSVTDGDRCPRCRQHLHSCGNCLFSTGVACILQRPEAHDRAWPGHQCPRFNFRETVAAERAPITGPPVH